MFLGFDCAVHKASSVPVSGRSTVRGEFKGLAYGSDLYASVGVAAFADAYRSDEPGAEGKHDAISAPHCSLLDPAPSAPSGCRGLVQSAGVAAGHLRLRFLSRSDGYEVLFHVHQPRHRARHGQLPSLLFMIPLVCAAIAAAFFIGI